jgi:RimJ/RimL family protein N-acetyltransferase
MLVLDLPGSQIRTARLVLRPLREGDDARLFNLFANWNVMRFLSSPPWPYTREDANAFVRLRIPPEQTDSITRAITHDGVPIGCIDVIRKPASAVQREEGYNLGYWLGEPFWGAGFMSEAARALVAHFFATKGDEVLYSGAFSENVASLRIQEKLGFERDGDNKLYSRPRDGAFPHVSTSVTRATFERIARMPRPDRHTAVRRG